MDRIAARLGLESRRTAKLRRFRLLFWASLVALLFGLTGLGRPVEEVLRTTRNTVRMHPASGRIVVIGIDDRSLAELESWPWPRRRYAEIADALANAGASRVLFDMDYSSPSTAAEDIALEAGLARFPGEVVLPALYTLDPVKGARTEHLPLARLRAHVKQASIVLRYDYRGAVWQIDYAHTYSGGVLPTFAAKLAEVTGEAERTFPIDHAIDYRTVPVISAADLINGKVPRGALAGKDVLVGATSHQLGDTFFSPNGFMIAGVYLHVLGAETLRAGVPVGLGWLPAFLAAAVIAGAALWLRSARGRLLLLCGAIVAILAAPLGLDMLRLYVDVMPAVMLLLVMAGGVGWQRYRTLSSAKAAVHPVSGLPNLAALREAESGHNRPLVVARITNFAEIASSLPPEQEKALIQQIAGRLTLGSAGYKLYQGDAGVFVWFADDEMAVTLADHLNALHTLFRSPVRLGASQVDLTIAFGIEAGGARSTTNRLGSALVAADEAAAEGLRWKQYDAERLKEAPWRLSLLSQLDAAIDAGDLWIAYQPKLDLRTRRTVGAEALVRWTHPEKGPISPAEFVLAAEQSGRIHKLTSYVLERAIQSAAAVNRKGVAFSVAINLSARLVDDGTLPERIAALLAKHQLAAGNLTLEITETAALGTSSAHLDNLDRLRALGVQISVDDYGTGLSTLDYLKKIPAGEIKIDRSFVQAMHRSEGDRVIVNSTIQLAHSLGRKVVAEGVEDRETLYTLSLMGCDLAQGFFIGRPMPLRSLARHLFQERSEMDVAVG
jgi:EAL domain-containing protein (putative c-di-GMP-specific phosphodiesterase class I)/CHASE2 domain-containing sensor protein